MKNLYIILGTILLIIIIICIIRKCTINITTKEYFMSKSESLSNNLLKNGSFQHGHDISGSIIKRGINNIVKILDNPNCDTSQYVLEQNDSTNSNDGSIYIVPISVQSSHNYRLTIWCAIMNKSKKIDLVHIKTHSDNLCQNTDELNVKTIITDKKEIDNLTWYKHDMTFMIPNGTNSVMIELGCLKYNKIGKRYFTDLVLLPYLPHAANFEATIGLKTFLDAYNKYSCSNGNGIIWNDLSNYGFTYKWSKKPTWNDEGYFKVKNNTLTGPTSQKLLENGLEFSFIMHAKSNRSDQDTNQDTNQNSNQNIQSLFVPGNPGTLGTAVGINIPNNYGKVYLIINGEIFETKENIRPQNNHIYTVTYKDNTLELWINDILLETFNNVRRPYFNEMLIKINREGNWETDLYAFLVYDNKIDENKIRYINYYLKNHPTQPIPLIMPSDKLQKPSISLTTPLDKLITPLDKLITPLDKLKKVSKSIELEKDSDVCPTCYKRGSEYIVYIPRRGKYAKIMGYGERSYGPSKERAHQIYRANFPGCKMPKILRFDRIPHHECPYILAKHNPCNNKYCRNVDWSKEGIDKMGMNAKCNANVSFYCRIHKDKDPSCWCWKDINIENRKCQNYRRQYENPEDYGFTVNMFEIEDHPDFKNYIRKDRIPCWNCNLDASVPKGTVIKTRNWQNIGN